MPMPCSRQGENEPLVTTPPPSTGLPWRAIRLPESGTGRASRADRRRARRHGLGSDEAGGLLAAPAEPGTDRIAILAQSFPYRWKQASSRSVSRAPSPQAGRLPRAGRSTPGPRRRDPGAARRRPRRCSRAADGAGAPPISRSVSRKRAAAGRHTGPERGAGSGPCTASMAK